ncbi:unnamed protein product [Caenorhabditis bovis]|uniref:Innexin n=1 Tax=Caenorhabditis bovis TaxID=2654633 RepID=A0A8S1E6I3_9PELO|nr:unnamed protein product [Caenorhabditis bovis]
MVMGNSKFKIPFFGINYVCDKLYNILTPSILLVFACFLLMKSKLGTPISCIFPKSYNEKLIEISKSICWNSNDTYLYMDMFHEKAATEVFKYTYLWLFFLSFMLAAIGFIWMGLESYIGSSMKYFSETTDIIKNLYEWERAEKVDEMARKMTNIQTLPVIKSRSRILIKNLVIKLFYIGCVMFQFLAMSRIIGENFDAIWGIQILAGKHFQITYDAAVNFPHIVYCSIRTLKYPFGCDTFPCVIAFNLLNEYIFALLSIWMTILLIIMAADIAKFVVKVQNCSYMKQVISDVTFSEEAFLINYITFIKISGKEISIRLARRLQYCIGFDAVVGIQIVSDISQTLGLQLMRKMVDCHLIDHDFEENEQMFQILNVPDE